MAERDGPGAAMAAAAVLPAGVDVGRVRAVLALGGVPLDEMEDGVQQVCLKLLEQQADTEKPAIANPAAWVSVVASRVAVDWHRSRAREASLRQRLASRWSVRAPAEHPESERVLALALAAVLDELPAAQRQLLLLRFHADLTVPQMAEHLQVPEGTVKSRLHTAVSALRSTLREKEVL